MSSNDNILVMIALYQILLREMRPNLLDEKIVMCSEL
jgi:hypothetical protein